MGGVICAVNQLVRGSKCECIRKDMADIELILSEYRNTNCDLEDYIKLTKCFQKQSPTLKKAINK